MNVGRWGSVVALGLAVVSCGWAIYLAEVDDVLAHNPKAVADYSSGEHKIVGFLVGQVMAATQGKADPRAVNELIRSRLDGS